MGHTLPATSFINWVLPAPLPPMSSQRWPGPVRQSTPRSTARSPRSRSMRRSVRVKDDAARALDMRARELTGEISATRGASGNAQRSVLVGRQTRVGFVGGLIGRTEQRLEVRGQHAVEQLLDVIEHEVRLLISVDQIVRAEHALEIEGDA